MDVRDGPLGRLSAKESMLSDCGWRRLLRVLWTARRSSQSILKEVNPERTDAEVEAPILWPPDLKR